VILEKKSIKIYKSGMDIWDGYLDHEVSKYYLGARDVDAQAASRRVGRGARGFWIRNSPLLKKAPPASPASPASPALLF